MVDLGLALSSRHLREVESRKTEFASDELRQIIRIQRSLLFCNGYVSWFFAHVDVFGVYLNDAASLQSATDLKATDGFRQL